MRKPKLIVWGEGKDDKIWEEIFSELVKQVKDNKVEIEKDCWHHVSFSFYIPDKKKK